MPPPSRTARCRNTVLCSAALGLLGVASQPAWPQDRTGGCPDVSGHYRTVAYSAEQADVITALEAPMAGFIGSEVMLDMSADGKIAVHVKNGSKGVLLARPARVLVKGVDFDCRDGAVVLRREIRALRKTEKAFLEGRASVRLAPASGSGLNLWITFNGSERTAFFGYESARLSLPTPGTGVTLTDTLRWPDISEPGPPPEPAPRVVSKDELDARRMLQPLLHPVILGGLRPSGDAVLASLKAPTSEHAMQFEERLRQARVPYEMKTAPIWSDGGYFMELLIRPARDAAAHVAAARAAQRPSTAWVTQTMNGAMHEPGLHVTGVEAEGDAYVATLSVVGRPDAQRAIARLKLNADRFAVVVPLSEVPDALHPNVRIARRKVLLR
jgi:hypothetical protein